MSRLVAALAGRPRLAAVVLGVLLALALPGLLGEAPESPWTGDSQWDQAAETSDRFGLGERIGWIALFGPVDATDGALRALEAVEAAVEAEPWIDQVVTPRDVPSADFADGLSTLDHPLAGPLLTSPGGYLLPFILADWSEDLTYPSEWVEAVNGIAGDALQGAGLGEVWEAGVTGGGPVIRAQSAAFRRERAIYTGLGVLLVLVISAAAFRNLFAVLLAGSGPIVGVLVAIGLSRRIGLAAEGFTGVVLPLLVLTIGFTDSLHLVIAAARAQHEGGKARSPGASAVLAARELAWPCYLTSVTTAIGFGSLVLASNPVVVQFGLSCALGTLLTFVCVLLVIPCLAHTPLGGGLAQTKPRTFRLKGIDQALKATLGHPRRTAAAAGILTLTLLGITSQLSVDKRVRDDLARGSEAVQILERSDAKLGGVFPLHVRMDWEESIPLASVLAASDKAARILAAEPAFSAGVGPAQLVESIAAGGGPFVRAAAPLALSALPELWLRPFVNLDLRSALVHARVQDAGTASLVPAFQRVRAQLQVVEEPGLRLTLGGYHVAHLETTERVARELKISLGVAALLILVTLGIAFRSSSMALASAIPNVFPVAASAAGLTLTGGGADLSSLTALTLALGIAADDTIHVLAQWQLARRAGHVGEQAARVAVHRTLPAISMTTLTLIAAFSLLLTSSIPIVTSFGLLVAVTLAAAFLADVWFLPALLVATSETEQAAGTRS